MDEDDAHAMPTFRPTLLIQVLVAAEIDSAMNRATLVSQTIHDATNGAEVARCLSAGGFISPAGRFQGVLEPSRTIGDVDVKADAPKGCIASYPEVIWRSVSCFFSFPFLCFYL